MNMKWNKMLVAGVLLVLTTSFGQVVQAKETSQNTRTITVQGNSQINVTPDQAEISISVVSNAPTAKEAQTDNANLASNVQERLLSLGIDQANIRTAQYNIYPNYSNETDKKPLTIINYHVTNTITVTLYDVTMVGNVIDTTLSAGANQISNIHFSKKDDLALQQLVLQGAVKEATAKAEAIARMLDKRIIGVIAVNESGVSVQIPEFQSKSFRSDAMATSTPITPGTIKANGSVNIVFEIE